FTIPIINAHLTSGSETVGIALGSPTGGGIGSVANAVLTISNNESPGVIQFNSPSFIVSDTSAKISITVNRTGGAGGIVTVGYSATAVTAIPGGNFTPVSGVLTFNPGETTKLFAVPILNAPGITGSTTVRLALSTPTGGATLGSTSSATL